MKLNKKLSVILATIITSSAILISSATVAHAKASSIVVATPNGSNYEYSYADLKSSATSSIIGDTAGAGLYNHFLQNKASIKAYFDDVRNAYIPMTAISEEAVACVLAGKTFDFKAYTENSTTPTTTITTTKIDSSVTPTPGDNPDSTDFDVESIQ